MHTRRTFLKTGSLVSLSPVLPCVLRRTAQAAAAERDARVLVVVQLDGGNDGLNTVVPYANAAYARARPTLKLDPKRLHKLDDQVALHSAMQNLKKLYDDGRLAIVQGVGYPNPDRSHFRSMKIWQTASFDDAQHNAYGWIGRALDQQRGSAFYVGDGQTPVALWGRRSQATALDRADDLELRAPAMSPPARDSSDPISQFVTREITTAYRAAKEFQQQTSRDSARGTTYPNTKLGEHLRLTARLLKSGSPARVYYASHSGYDTHSAQQYTHARLLREYSDAVAAFMDDLKESRLDDRVTLLAFSEFGRRVKENDSKGTDHGTAGPVFLAGGAIHSGLIGAPPSLTDLDSGDLRMQTDFRQVYHTLLNDWLGVDAGQVLGNDFSGLKLVRA